MQALGAAPLSQHTIPAQQTLPPLREDLRLNQVDSDRLGLPGWVIEDPARSRFFRIGWLEFELLTRWDRGSPERVLAAVREETTLDPTTDDMKGLLEFLLQHQLLRTSSESAAMRAAAGGRGFWSKLFHQYLMFRISLWHPARFLEASLPFVRPLLSPAAGWLSVVAALTGLALAGQQWDTFTHTFSDTFTPAGALGFALALVCAKALHELGHAYTATARGTRVGHMGVVFIVMFPLLYTDTNESWKLARDRDRFNIACAGLRAELMLASWCTLAWSLLPDGGLRGAMFFLATTSWIISTILNASPFMRFDGYFMLSDLSGIPNLHQAAFAAARDKAGQLLWGLPAEEEQVRQHGTKPTFWLAAFGLATAVYRLIMFAGIAYAVYAMFFKLLGIFLFAAEVAWFIVLPVSKLIAYWWKVRTSMRRAPVLRTLALGAGLLLLATIPWQKNVSAYGLIRASSHLALYSPFPATLEIVPIQGQHVVQGNTVVALASRGLVLRGEQSRVRGDSLDRRLSALAVDRKGMEQLRKAVSQIAQQETESKAVVAEAGRLALTAPFSGRVLDTEPGVRRGTTVAASMQLGTLVDPSAWEGEAFVPEESVERIKSGA